MVECGIREKNESKMTPNFLLWTTRWTNISFTELQRIGSLENKGEMDLVLRVLRLRCLLVIQVERSMYIKTRELG